MPEPIFLARAAAAAFSDDRVRKGVGWVLVVILSPLIVVIALLCSLGSGAAAHNASAVELCFQGGVIPSDVPEEYRTYINEMRGSFTLLDAYIADINSQMEDGASLDAERVKAIFFALYFGMDAPGAWAHRQFADCFVTYEPRTRFGIEIDEFGNESETEEEYTVAVPVEDISVVYTRLANTLSLGITDSQRTNADSIYCLVHYGWAGASAWLDELSELVVSSDGFVSPLGSGWQARVSSEFGWRICPYHGQEYHSGLDMAAPAGMPIRAALSGTVTKCCRDNSLGNYTVINCGNGVFIGYAHQSRQLVSLGDAVEAGDIIGLVGSTGDSTGPHLHLEVRVNGQLQDPRNYLP